MIRFHLKARKPYQKETDRIIVEDFLSRYIADRAECYSYSMGNGFMLFVLIGCLLGISQPAKAQNTQKFYFSSFNGYYKLSKDEAKYFPT